jgi:hypothetical protein
MVPFSQGRWTQLYAWLAFCVGVYLRGCLCAVQSGRAIAHESTAEKIIMNIGIRCTNATGRSEERVSSHRDMPDHGLVEGLRGRTM